MSSSNDRARLRIKDNSVIALDCLDEAGSVVHSDTLPWNGAPIENRKMYDGKGELIAVLNVRSDDGSAVAELSRADGTVMQREALGVQLPVPVAESKPTTVVGGKSVRSLATYESLCATPMWIDAAWRVAWAAACALMCRHIYFYMAWNSMAALGAAWFALVLATPAFVGIPNWLGLAFEMWWRPNWRWFADEAANLTKEGRHKEAVTLLERGLLMYDEESVRQCEAALELLAQTHKTTKQWDKAVACRQMLLSACSEGQAEVAQKHLLELGELYVLKSKFDWAEPVLQRMLQQLMTSREWLEPEYLKTRWHSDIKEFYRRKSQAYFLLAQCCRERKQFSQAEAYLQEAIPAAVLFDEKNITEQMSWRYVLANCQAAQEGKAKQAEQTYREVLEYYRMERALGRDHSEAPLAFQEVAALLRKQGRHAEAEEWQRLGRSLNFLPPA